VPSPGPACGPHLAACAEQLGLAGKPGSGAFYLPLTANGLGVTEAWAAAADDEPANPEPTSLLIVSGDEAAADPNVRALAEQAERVLATTMFQGLAVGWADLVLPGTSYLERDGTYMNLEGRLQRLRRAVIPPAPDELAWISRLAERFGVQVSPYASTVFEELSERIFRGLPFGEVGERAPLRAREPVEDVAVPSGEPTVATKAGELRLLRYRSLFTGPAVERVPELQFQRPEPVVELSTHDARRLGVASGEEIDVRSNGTSARLRVSVNRRLTAGVARVAEDHAGDLGPTVQVARP
jgi:NADH-quinone oxidoreductase subunit G